MLLDNFNEAWEYLNKIVINGLLSGAYNYNKRDDDSWSFTFWNGPFNENPIVIELPAKKISQDQLFMQICSGLCKKSRYYYVGIHKKQPCIKKHVEYLG